MKTLIHHLRFQPHGNRLLTSAAAFWFFSARIPVSAMALSEAAAWGYLGSLFGDGIIRWICAAFMGIIIFLIVWVIDVSLITLDRASKEHAAEILQQPSKSSGILDVATFGLRILLLLGSLTITAPYLAQLVFNKDIQRDIDAQAVAAIDKARNQIVAHSDALIADQERTIGGQRLRYEREVAGKGMSGKFGDGPAAKAMRADMNALVHGREELMQQKDSNLRNYDRLAADWQTNRDQLAAKYGVDIPQASILENRQVMEKLSQRPEFQSTELAIRGFLGFIFMGLLLLKFFEPRSVRLYLSDVLQQEYGRYLAGTFDHALPPTEKSTNKLFQISPQRLYEFLVKVWVPARSLEAQQANVQARTSAAGQALAVLEGMKTTLDSELAQASGEVQRVCSLVDEANKSLTDLRSAIAQINGDVLYYQSELSTLDNVPTSMDEKSQLEYRIKSLEYRSYLQKKIADADRALCELNDAIPLEMEKFNRANAALQRVDVRLKEKDAELKATQDKIRDVRNQLRNSAGERAYSFLSV